MKSFLDLAEDCDLTNFPELKVWENVAKELPTLNEKGGLRELICTLPEVNLNEIKGNEGALQRTYTIFTFIAHSYVRGRSDIEILPKLPAKIAGVWIESAKLLGLPPISTYSSSVLFNTKSIQSTRPTNPEDFEILFTFTGTEDEKWFYAVSAGVDVLSGELIGIVEGGQLEDEDVGMRISEIIDKITSVIDRMYEKCRPDVFFNRIRRYFSGWFNDPRFSKAGGLEYEISKDESIILNLAGGSAAQNPTIQLLDILLNVNHENESEYTTLCDIEGVNGCCPVVTGSYLKAMRDYMPREHREFLSMIERDNNLRLKGSAKGYSECIKSLINFRSQHIKMVTRYIICQNTQAKGTGGSNPIPFLKRLRDDTGNCLLK